VGVLASYSYDNAGRRTGVTYGNGTSRSYGYDAISRLTGLQMTFPNASGYNHTIGGLNGTGTAISYSPASQIASIAKSNDSFAWTSATNADRNYTTNGLNQYTSDGQVSFGYDGRGNLTSSGVLSFGYNKENQLISGPGGTTLYYDPLGRLSEYDTNVSTRFYYSGAAIAAEIANDGTNAVLRRYVMGPGTDEPIVWYEGSAPRTGVSCRPTSVGRSSRSRIQVEACWASTNTTNMGYRPMIGQLNNIGRFQYTGQAWYGEVGLYNFKARWYSPSLGRFMQTDPIGYGDGLNWHNYVGSDPINGTDPSGLKTDKPKTSPPHHLLFLLRKYRRDWKAFQIAEGQV
jgi:RHS repeat-associated protein